MLLGSEKAPRMLFVLGSGVSSKICPNVEKITDAVLKCIRSPAHLNSSAASVLKHVAPYGANWFLGVSQVLPPRPQQPREVMSEAE
jgi:hypothetical protein